MLRTLFYILIVLLFSNYGNNKKHINETLPSTHFSPICYAGCITSISVIKKDGTTFDDTLTAFANYMYDSVMSSKVEVKSQFNISKSEPSLNLKLLSSEITQSVITYHRNKDLNQIPFSSVIDSFASLHADRYTSYFVNYGNIWTKKQNRQKIAVNTLKYSAIVLGIALYTTLIIISNTNTGWWDFNSPSDNFDGHYEPSNSVGIKCNYLIYDKKEKRFCYIKSHIFKSDKTDNNPFNPKRVAKQISLFL
jgi:hypothetical protein